MHQLSEENPDFIWSLKEVLFEEWEQTPADILKIS